jgi:hypothetical protein
MAGITLAQAETALANWIAADAAVSGGQSYSIGSRQLTRVNAGEIRDSIEFWESKVNQLSKSNKGIRVRGATPSD